MKRIIMPVLLVLLCHSGFGQLKLSQLPFTYSWDTAAYGVGVEISGGTPVDYLYRMPFISSPDSLTIGFPLSGCMVVDTLLDASIQAANFGVYDASGNNYLWIDVSDAQYAFGDGNASLSLDGASGSYVLQGDGQANISDDFQVTSKGNVLLDIDPSDNRYSIGDAVTYLSLNDGTNDTLQGDLYVLESNDFNVSHHGIPCLDLNATDGSYSIGDNNTNVTISSGSTSVSVNSSKAYFKALSGSGTGIVCTNSSGQLSVNTLGVVTSRDATELSASVSPFLAYTVPSGTSPVCQVGGYVTVLSSGSPITVQLVYIDENSAAQVIDIPSEPTNITGSGSITITGAGAYQLQATTIRCKSGSSIAININTSGSHYDAGAWISVLHF